MLRARFESPNRLLSSTQPLMSSSPSEPGVDAVVGLELAGYLIMRALASGGMGVVYEGLHPLIDRRVAVKVLRPEVATVDDWASRFITEAKAISAIKHRNIVEIVNFGVIPDGRQYMMMEFLDGESLESLIQRESPTMVRDVLRIADEVLNGLEAAHSVGVVHRDLKPANVFLLAESTGERIVKLVDFGLARQCGELSADFASISGTRKAATSLLAGTPEYINPEQASGKPVGAQGDLYSLGVIMFEMLVGHRPFEANSTTELLRMHREDTAPRVSSYRTDLPDELDDFIARLLAKSPSSRPQSALAARTQVQRLLRVVHDQPTAFGAKSRHTEKFPTLDSAVSSVSVFSKRIPIAIALGVAIAIGGLFAAFRSAPAVPPARAQLLAVPQPSEQPVIVTAVPRAVDSAENSDELAVLEPVKRLAPIRNPLARVPSRSCVPDEVWKKAGYQRIDELQSLAMARLPLDATLRQVDAVKNKARGLVVRMKSAQAADCAVVDRDVDQWRSQLKR